MTAAMDGSFQDNHSDTARKWQERFASRPANPNSVASIAIAPRWEFDS
jgi:hypothetical protein